MPRPRQSERRATETATLQVFKQGEGRPLGHICHSDSDTYPTAQRFLPTLAPTTTRNACAIKNLWEDVYGSKAPTTVSWYAPHLTESLFPIHRTGLPKSAAVIDVGGGESTLADDLLDEGYTNLSVLDISSKALDVCRQRLGECAECVRWIAANVLEHPFEPRSVDIWHDRAVFHFLADEGQRRAYVTQVLRALRPGGYAVVGEFGPGGPTQCSGLPVARSG